MLECSAVRSPCTTFSVKVFLSFFLLKSFLSRHKEQSSSGEGEFFRFLIGVRHQIFFKSWPRFWSTNAIFSTKDQEQTTNNARCSLIIVFITSAKYFLELFIRRSVPPPLPWNIVRRVRLHGRSVYFTFNLSPLPLPTYNEAQSDICI